MTRTDSPGFPRGWAVALALLALAVIMTWPLGRLWQPTLPIQPDSQFNVWRLAWVAHQLRADPLHLFDANIFVPASNTLAYSDAMLLLGVAAAPLIWAGLHPFIVHNLLTIAAFWLAAYAAYLLCARLVGAGWPAVVGALISGFAPYRFAHVSHLELLWTACLPLAVVALVDLMGRPSPGTALRLARYQILQTLCSVYYGVFLPIYVGLVAALSWRTRTRPATTTAGLLAGSAVLASVLLLPYALRYREAGQSVAPRTTAEISRFSAVPADYLRVSRDNRIPLLHGGDAEEERSLYPGAIAALLAAWGLVGRSRTAVTFAILLLVSADLSFGMNGWLYPLLLQMVPMLAGLRAPARFHAFVLVSLSVVAAEGARRLLLRGPQRAWLAPAIVALIVAEYWAAPLKTVERPMQPPAVYAWLASQPRGVVLEWPVPVPEALWGFELDYQLMSIYHWQPMLNGYSGHAPADYLALLETLRDFPSEAAIETLKARKVRWILVHESLLKPDGFAALMLRVLESGALTPLATFDDGFGPTVVLELRSTTL